MRFRRGRCPVESYKRGYRNCTGPDSCRSQRAKYPGARGPICKGRLSPTSKSRVPSLVQRKTTHNSAPRFPLYRRKKENARVRERALQSSEPNGAIIRTFANQLDERCENCRRETLPLSLFSLSFSLVCLVHWAQL